MTTIWNENEKKKISYYLRKANLKISQDGKLIINSTIPNNYLTSVLINEQEKIKELYYCQNEEEIIKILNNCIKIKELVESEKENPLYFGLLKALSEINTNDKSEIFTIFNEIISQYIKIINVLSRKIEQQYPNANELKEKIESIKTSTIETEEEKYIKNYLSLIFNYTKEITDSDIFKKTIEKYNKNIKILLVKTLEQKYGILKRKEEKIKDKEYYSYMNDSVAHLCRIKSKKPIYQKRG